MVPEIDYILKYFEAKSNIKQIRKELEERTDDFERIVIVAGRYPEFWETMQELSEQLGKNYFMKSRFVILPSQIVDLIEILPTIHADHVKPSSAQGGDRCPSPETSEPRAHTEQNRRPSIDLECLKEGPKTTLQGWSGTRPPQ